MDSKYTYGDKPQNFLETMEKLEAANAAQEYYAKKQYTMSLISAAASVLMLLIVIVCAVILMPKVMHTFEQVDVVFSQVDEVFGQVDEVFGQIDDVYQQLGTVMTDLEGITSELSDSLPDMLKEMDTLMTTSGEGINEALSKVSAIDIKTLNSAIADLQAIVEPLAKLFGRNR